MGERVQGPIADAQGLRDQAKLATMHMRHFPAHAAFQNFGTLGHAEGAVIRRAVPHYGLRYGFASAIGNFQLLRGRPPLLSALD